MDVCCVRMWMHLYACVDNVCIVVDVKYVDHVCVYMYGMSKDARVCMCAYRGTGGDIHFPRLY